MKTQNKYRLLVALLVLVIMVLVSIACGKTASTGELKLSTQISQPEPGLDVEAPAPSYTQPLRKSDLAPFTHILENQRRVGLLTRPSSPSRIRVPILSICR